MFCLYHHFSVNILNFNFRSTFFSIESKCMNNEVPIEEYDKNLRQTTKMASDNEQKLDELTRKLGVQEDELRRALERAELAENKLKSIEEELQIIISKKAVECGEEAEAEV